MDQDFFFPVRLPRREREEIVLAFADAIPGCQKIPLSFLSLKPPLVEQKREERFQGPRECFQNLLPPPLLPFCFSQRCHNKFAMRFQQSGGGGGERGEEGFSFSSPSSFLWFSSSSSSSLASISRGMQKKEALNQAKARRRRRGVGRD